MIDRFLSFLALTLAFLLTTLLGGCSSAEDSPLPQMPPDSVIVVVGVHQGGPAPAIPVDVADLLVAAAHAAASFTVIASDGTPEKIYRSADYTVSAENPEASETDVNAQVNDLVAAVSGAAADADGNDLAAALAMAGDQARADDAVRPAIIVIDNGISDRGFPAMTADGMTTSAEPSSVVEFASSRDYLLGFPEGTSIVLVGLGYTAPPQPAITAAQRERLIAVWSGFLAAGGAEVTVLPTPRPAEGPDTAFTTGVLPPAAYDQITITDTDGRTEIGLAADVLFDFDDASLRDDHVTTDALGELADYLMGYAGPITVHGYADAIGEADANLALSRQRTQAIAQWLVDHGVLYASQIRQCGHGESDLAVPDAATEAEHQLNRRVVIALEENPC